MTTMDTGRLRNTLKHERAKRNLTQEQVADLVGVSRLPNHTPDESKVRPGLSDTNASMTTKRSDHP
jgi:transcriptional regulator with XRE-family HTH domain